LNEQITISVYVVKKEGLKEPYVIGSGAIQPKLVFKATKKGAPAAAEISANLHPQSLNTGIVSGAKSAASEINTRMCLMSLTSPTKMTPGSGHVS
jgi:hypothetical protein